MAISEQTMQKIILAGDKKTLVDEAKKLGKELAEEKRNREGRKISDGLKMSQLRNVYGAVRQAANLWEINPQKAYDQMILLQPKMAYYAKRTRELIPLQQTIDLAINLLRQDTKPDEDHFQNFVDFNEAIVAFHNAHRKGND